MGYKFRIEYKSRASNRVAVALSRRDGPEATTVDDVSLFVAVSQPLPDILEILRADVRTDPKLQELAAQIAAGTAPTRWTMGDDLLYQGRQIMVAASSVANPALLYEHHSTPTAGHPGVE